MSFFPYFFFQATVRFGLLYPVFFADSTKTCVHLVCVGYKLLVLQKIAPVLYSADGAPFMWIIFAKYLVFAQITLKYVVADVTKKRISGWH